MSKSNKNKTEAPQEVEAPKKPVDTMELTRAKGTIKFLTQENVKLKDEVTRLRDENSNVVRVPERYSDVFDDSKAPLKDPSLGDLTPTYVDWARENMPKEIFNRRYQGRRVPAAAPKKKALEEPKG